MSLLVMFTGGNTCGAGLRAWSGVGWKNVGLCVCVCVRVCVCVICVGGVYNLKPVSQMSEAPQSLSSECLLPSGSFPA